MCEVDYGKTKMATEKLNVQRNSGSSATAVAVLSELNQQQQQQEKRELALARLLAPASVGGGSACSGCCCCRSLGEQLQQQQQQQQADNLPLALHDAPLSYSSSSSSPSCRLSYLQPTTCTSSCARHRPRVQETCCCCRAENGAASFQVGRQLPPTSDSCSILPTTTNTKTTCKASEGRTRRAQINTSTRGIQIKCKHNSSSSSNSRTKQTLTVKKCAGNRRKLREKLKTTPKKSRITNTTASHASLVIRLIFVSLLLVQLVTQLNCQAKSVQQQQQQQEADESSSSYKVKSSIPKIKSNVDTETATNSENKLDSRIETSISTTTTTIRNLSPNSEDSFKFIGNKLNLLEEEAELGEKERGEEKKQNLISIKRNENKLTTRETPATTTPATPATLETTTTTTDNEDDSSAGHDDDDAEGCTGLSADESAKGENLSDNERLVNLQTCLKQKMRTFLAGSARSSLEMFEQLSLSGSCTASLIDLMQAFGQIKSYAFKFFDASAKLPSGVMYGLLSDFGDFDQCLSIRSRPQIPIEDELEEGGYSGKYCLMSIKMNYRARLKVNETVPDGIQEDGLLWDALVRNYWTSNSTKGFQIGMCFPSRCTDDDLDQMYRLMATKYNFGGKIIACQDGLQLKKQSQPDLLQQVIIYTFYLLIGLTFAGTILDRYYHQAIASDKINHCSNRSEQIHNLQKKPFLENEKQVLNQTKICFGIVVSPNHQRFFTTQTSTNVIKILLCFSLTKNWRTFSSRKNQHELAASSSSNLSVFHSTGGYSSQASSTSLNRSSPTISEEIELNKGSSSVATDKISGNVYQQSQLIKETETETKFNENNKQASLLLHHHHHHQKQQQQDEKQLVELQSGGGGSVDDDKSLSQLAGLRFLVIIWITIGHSFLYPSANNYQYYRSIIKMNITRDSVWFATTNFTLGFDTFLYITGLCFVYKLFKPKNSMKIQQQQTVLRPNNMNDNKSLSQSPSTSSSSLWSCALKLKASRIGISRFIAEKILRFWPTYLSIIGLAIIVPSMSDGPMWPEMVGNRIGASCRNNWWSNLLFINNFLVEREICLPSSWFVSILMQLLFIGSTILYIVQKCSLILGMVLICFLIVASSGLTFMFAYLANVRAPIIRMDESFVMELDDNIFSLYTNIFNNIGPFLVGMLGGFLLLSSQLQQKQRLMKKTYRISSLPSVGGGGDASALKLTQESGSYLKALLRRREMFRRILGCLLVLVIAFLVLSSVFPQHYSRSCAAIYWSLHRVGWSIVTGYVIHNCATGRWKLLNDFLSMPLYVPLNRLIPIAYLIYPIFIHIHSGMVRDGLHVSIYNMLTIYTTRLVLTFVTSLFIHLLVELPFYSLSQVYLETWLTMISGGAGGVGADQGKHNGDTMKGGLSARSKHENKIKDDFVNGQTDDDTLVSDGKLSPLLTVVSTDNMTTIK